MAARRRRGHRPKNAFEERDLWKVSLLRTFVEAHGLEQVRKPTIVPPGVRLDTFVATIRRRYREDRLAGWLAHEFDQLPGWRWDPIGDQHRERLAQLRSLMVRGGVDAEAICAVGDWILVRWRRHRVGTLPEHERAELEALPGWKWSQRESRRIARR